MATTKRAQLSGANLIIVLVVVTILVITVAVLIGKVLLSSIILDTKVVNAKNKANNTLTTDLTAAPNLVQAYLALGPESQTLSDALPTTSDFPSLLVALENMANSSGIKLKAISPSSSALVSATSSASATSTSQGATGASGISAPPPVPYEFSVSFDGSYASLTKFLGQVETSARPMRVTSMELTGNGTALSAQLDLSTYYQAKSQLPLSKETIK